MKTLKAIDLKVGDKVRYKVINSAFMDMMVVKVDDKCVELARPYLIMHPFDEDKTSIRPYMAIEPIVFNRESTMEFIDL